MEGCISDQAIRERRISRIFTVTEERDMDGNLAVDYWVGREEALKLPVAPINRTPGMMNRQGVQDKRPEFDPLWRCVLHYREAKLQFFMLPLLSLCVYWALERWSVEYWRPFWAMALAVVITIVQGILLIKGVIHGERQRRLLLEQDWAHKVTADPTLGEMGWADYVSYLNPTSRPYVEALRVAIVAAKNKRGGKWHQESADGFPVFTDGTVAAFTLKGWGDLQAAIWSTEEPRFYAYTDFTRYGPNEEEPEPPKAVKM